MKLITVSLCNHLCSLHTRYHLYQWLSSPAAVGPVSSSLSIKNQMETVAFSKHDRFNVGPTPPVRPIPVLPTLNLSTRADKYLDQKRERDMLSLSLSLNLSLSCDHNSGAGSSGFNNKDGLISVG
ncbi:hypothetical protein HanPSC8_Chr16g0700171 [Helianthus annuus]|nr:hypothetical protein HanPSC8_Chr16g0700171 [Helianthus annuus]